MNAFYNELPAEILPTTTKWKRTDTKIANTTIHNMVSPERLDHAVKTAQNVEAKVLQMVKLSVQELVDCDTKFNRGCVGGNPVMAFPYIHKHGLVSSSQYPYEGLQHRKCHMGDLKTPVATSDSWGILKAKDEAGMKFALRHLGPLSVGFNGGDKSFLTYSGGIYDSTKCSNFPNHAILITGYGEETTKHGEVVSEINS